MSIQDIIDDRGIERVVHFTTNKGLIGILDSKLLKPRKSIKGDDRLEFILKHNSIRRDGNWLGYVNLSITDINKEFFDYSSKWHDDIFWCVLYFSPSIMTHEGVYFTTTNNIYPSVKRSVGEEGLEGLFKPIVEGKYQKQFSRPNNMPLCKPTDMQAEVLYPGSLSIEYLNKIVVSNGTDFDEVYSIIGALQRHGIEVIIDKNLFN